MSTKLMDVQILIRELPLKSIRTDGGTQARASLCMSTVSEYADAIQDGSEFPPLIVYHDGSDYWLGDGFHRWHGYKRAGIGRVRCEIRQGDVRDAILHACGANSNHGLKRTNADKRRAVETLLGDEEWVKWSDHKIAEVAAVSQNFVSDVRRQLKSDVSSPAAKAASEPREGRDGRRRAAPSNLTSPKSRGAVQIDHGTEDEDASGSTATTVDTAAWPDPITRKDPNGLPIPECLKDVWNSIETFNRGRQSISEALSCFTRLHGGTGVAGALLRTAARGDNVRVWLKKAGGAFKFSTPFCVCPSCGGSSSGCNVCGGRGFVSEDQFNQLPEEHKPLLAGTGAA